MPLSKEARRRKYNEDPVFKGRELAWMREYRAKNKDKFKGYHLKHHYGLSLDDYEALFVLQESKCAICQCPLVVRNTVNGAVVDHDHSNGVVRGLLCGACNRGLGQFKESLDVLKAAVVYMEAASQKEGGTMGTKKVIKKTTTKKSTRKTSK